MDKVTVRLIGGEADGEERILDLDRFGLTAHPAAIEAGYGGSVYTYATAIFEGQGEDRRQIFTYRPATVVDLDEI